MKKFLKYSFMVLFVLTLTNCTSDLDTQPEVELSLEELLSQDPQAIEGILSRLYASFALSGPDGPGSSDIPDDAGESPFLRGIVNLQDFTADAMKNRWGDDGLDQLTTTSDWTSENKFFRYLYNRIYYTIPQSNNLINVLSVVDVSNAAEISSEVRFIRALAYYYLIDAFGKGVLATEANLGSPEALPEVSRQDLFDFVESELLAIEPTLPTMNQYGRVTKGAAQMLLTKLYLNAEVYTGTARWDDAATYVNKVINENGYTLATDFRMIFSGDNDVNGAQNEIIFPLIADAATSQSFGNTTYIVNGSLSTETLAPGDFGATQGWTGHRASKGWYGLFGNSDADLANSSDVRASLFWTQGHNFEMNDYREWTDGYPSTKFRNSNFAGTSAATDFSNTDFPLFRLADAYLIYAELAARGAANTDAATGLGYLNQVRTRAGASSLTSYTDMDVLDERARELNLEGHRRSDLIRYNRFTGGSYIWPWKGGVAQGTSIPDTYKLFPIPTTALQANPNLTQNPGY
jgi:hypothetical protein